MTTFRNKGANYTTCIQLLLTDSTNITDFTKIDKKYYKIYNAVQTVQVLPAQISSKSQRKLEFEKKTKIALTINFFENYYK